MVFKKNVIRIIARHLMFSSSSKEKETLRNWRDQSATNDASYKTIKQIWHLRPVVDVGELSDVPVEKFFTRAGLIKAASRQLGWWKVAASVAMLVAFSSVMMQLLSFSGTSRVELMTDKGQRTEAVLPDGSKVWLNSCSKLVYEHRFGRIRTVSLQGEAFFDVSKNRVSPFMVDANGLEVRVTGTQFNVRNYANELVIETTLLEGSVNVTTPAGAKAKMVPGQTLSFSKNTNRLTRKNVNPNDNVSWKEGVLVFSGAPFNDFIVRLERWYNIRVIYQPEDFKDIHFTGTIRDLRLDQVFEFVSLTTPIEVDMGDNDIHLKRTQPKSSN